MIFGELRAKTSAVADFVSRIGQCMDEGIP